MRPATRSEIRHEEAEVHGQPDHRGDQACGGRPGSARAVLGAAISAATFYKWRSKYGGMDVSLMARMKELEA